MAAVRVPVPLADGPSAAETARVLRTLQLAMEVLRHDGAGRITFEPRLETKALLAAQLYDDARSLIKLARRLAELPDVEDVALAAAPTKAGVALTAREHLRRLDPYVDEHSVRLLTQLSLRQERHAAERDERTTPAPVAVTAGRPLPLDVRPRPEQPAREPFVEIGGAGDRGLHDLIHAKICSAELAAYSIHEQPDADPGLHADAARTASDATRHALVIDRFAGGIWGTHGVAAGYVTQAPPMPAAVAGLLR